jgi:cell division protein FtsA
MPLQYCLDNNIVENPYNINADKLQITFHLLSIYKKALTNIKDCIKAIMLNVENYVSDGYAVSLATLENNEKELGVVMFDIGSNTTNVSVIYDNKYVFEANIGIAGETITNDISNVLKITQSTAEKIKVLNTDFTLSIKDESELIRLSVDSDEEADAAKNTVGLINDITKARIEEIVEIAFNILKKNGLQNVPKYAVITGGTALIPGIDSFITKITGKEARVGYNTGFSIQDRDLAEQLKSPMYSVSMGILKFMQNKYANGGDDNDSDSSFFGFFKKILS